MHIVQLCISVYFVKITVYPKYILSYLILLPEKYAVHLKMSLIILCQWIQGKLEKRNMKSGWKRNIISSACFVKECWARLSHKNTVGGNGCMSKSIFQQIFLNLEWFWRKGHYCWISNGIFLRFFSRGIFDWVCKLGLKQFLTACRHERILSFIVDVLRSSDVLSPN